MSEGRQAVEALAWLSVDGDWDNGASLRAAYEVVRLVTRVALNVEDCKQLRDALLRSKEAWFEVSYNDGRKEVRCWDASRMSASGRTMESPAYG